MSHNPTDILQQYACLLLFHLLCPCSTNAHVARPPPLTHHTAVCTESSSVTTNDRSEPSPQKRPEASLLCCEVACVLCESFPDTNIFSPFFCQHMSHRCLRSRTRRYRYAPTIDRKSEQWPYPISTAVLVNVTSGYLD